MTQPGSMPVRQETCWHSGGAARLNSSPYPHASAGQRKAIRSCLRRDGGVHLKPAKPGRGPPVVAADDVEELYAAVTKQQAPHRVPPRKLHSAASGQEFASDCLAGHSSSPPLPSRPPARGRRPNRSLRVVAAQEEGTSAADEVIEALCGVHLVAMKWSADQLRMPRWCTRAPLLHAGGPRASRPVRSSVVSAAAASTTTALTAMASSMAEQEAPRRPGPSRSRTPPR